MSSFAANAVGFYLQLEDQLSPALISAESKYSSFTKKLTAWNAKAVTALNKGMSAVTQFVEQLGDLDAQFDKVMKVPLTKKVKLMFDAKEAASFGKNVSQAVAKVLSKVKFNIVSKGGKSGGMTGTITNLPRFAKGGFVGPPPAGGFDPGSGDNQIIAAKTGELVQTADQANTMSGAVASMANSVQKMTSAEKAKAKDSLETLQFLKTVIKDTGKLAEINDGIASLEARLGLVATATASTAKSTAVTAVATITSNKATAVLANTTPIVPEHTSNRAKAVTANTPAAPANATTTVLANTPPVASTNVATAVTPAKVAAVTSNPAPVVGGQWASAAKQGPPAPPAGPSGVAAWTSATPALVTPPTPPPPPPTFGEQFKGSLKTLTDQQKAFRQLADAYKLGIVKSSDFNIAQKSLWATQKGFDKFVKQHDYQTLKPFIHDIGDAREHTKSLTDAAKTSMPVWEKLLSQVFGPAKFLAVNRAIGELQSGFSKLANAAHASFGGLGGKLDDFVTNFNSINKMAGLTRTELRKVKEAAADATSQFGGSFDLAEFSETFESLRKSGLTDLKLVNELAKSATLFQVATDADRGSVTELYNTLHYQSNLAVKDIADVTATIAQASYLSGKSAGQLTADLKQNVDSMSNYFITSTDATQKNILANMTNLNAALSGEAGKAGEQLTDILAKASGGDTESLHKIGFLTQGQTSSQAQVQQMLETGKGVEEMINAIADTTKRLGPQFDVMAENALPGINPKDLALIGKSSDKVIASLREMHDKAIGAGTGLDYLKEHADATMPFWQKWVKSVGNFLGSLSLLGVKGVDVIDFFKDFGLQNLHALAYLLEFTGALPFAGKALGALGTITGSVGKKVWGLAKSFLGLAGNIPTIGPAVTKLGATLASTATTVWDATKSFFGFTKTVSDTASTAALTAKGFANVSGDLSGIATVAAPAEKAVAGIGEAAAAAAAPTMTLGARIADLGVGLGTFITEIGVGVGGAILGFLSGLAAGIVALGTAVSTGVGFVGLLALVGLMLAFAGALNIAAPAIEAFGKALSDLSASQMLALGPALAMTGIGFMALATSVSIGANVMLAAVPALAALGVVMWAFNKIGGSGEVGMIASVMDGLASQFTVDPEKMKAAVTAIGASVAFIGSLLALSSLLTVAGLLHAGGLIGGLLSGIRDFFLGDPMQNLKNDAAKMADTMNALSASMNTIDVKAAAEAGPKMAIVAAFTKDYATASNALKDSSSTGGLIGALHWIFAGSKLGNAVSEIDDVVEAVNALVKGFKDAKFSDDLPATAEKLKAVAVFTEAYGKIATGIKAGMNFNTWGSGGVGGFFATVWGGDDFKKFKAILPKIKNNITAMVTQFGDPKFVQDKDELARAKAGIGVMADLMTAFGPALEAANKAGIVADKLTVGAILGFFGKTSGLEDIQTALPNVVDTIKLLVPAMADISATVGGKAGGGNLDGLATAIQMVQSMGGLLMNLAGFAGTVRDTKGALKDLGKGSVGKVVIDAVSSVASLAGQIRMAVGDKVGDLAAVQSIAAQIKSMQELVESTGQLGMAVEKYQSSFLRLDTDSEAVIHAVNGVMSQIQHVTHDVNVPPLSTAQLQQAATVTVQGNVTANDATTHDLLAQIVSLMSARQATSPQAANTPVGPSQATQAFASGRGS